MIARTLLLAVMLAVSVVAFYDKDSAVFELTAKNFKEEVINSDEFWLVEFYAPWCGHCKRLKPDFEKAAQILKGIVRIGAVNMDEEREAGAPYQVQGYPTIKFFGRDKKTPLSYESGAREFDDLVKYCLEQLKDQIKLRQEQESTEL